jgi:hypothetical protein
MDERLNIAGDPEAVLRALIAIPCLTDQPILEPETGDEAIQRLIDRPDQSS